ncbi:MAG: hypothetical protein ACR2K5_12985 [Pseudolabrys sp.]
MAQDLPALRQESVQSHALDPAVVSAQPGETDYDFFCATVMATTRGRGFLAEYVRRHRNADTQAVLAALRRIENMVRAAPAAPPLARVQGELRALAAILREARHDLRGNGGALSSASKVMALLDLLEARIVSMLEAGAAPTAAVALPPSRIENKVELGRLHLSVVPPPPEPAASSPSAALLPPLMAGEGGAPLVVIARRPLPEVAPRTPSQSQKPALPPPAATEPVKPLKDRFADVMALSEEERIALFT